MFKPVTTVVNGIVDPRDAAGSRRLRMVNVSSVKRINTLDQSHFFQKLHCRPPPPFIRLYNADSYCRIASRMHTIIFHILKAVSRN